MGYNLFLDDTRTPVTVYLIKKDERYLREYWEIARDFDEFKSLLIVKGIPQLVSFDHDLADIHYTGGVESFSYHEETGLDCAKYLVKMCIHFEVDWFPKFIIHSQNTVGRDNIESYLNSYIRTLK